MALGEQLSPTQTLVTFCLWAQRNGYSVGEMHGFSTVHPAVHRAGSWHVNEQQGFGKAADINKNGADEKAQLGLAVDQAQALGLAVIFARDGVAGEARTHQGHLHVDVGPFSHLGIASFKPRGGGDSVTDALQRAVRVDVDQKWGNETDTNLEAVRAASNLKGVAFPSGVEFTQRAIGAAVTGDWGQDSRNAHDRTTSAIRLALGVPDSVIWDVSTDAAYLRVRDLRRRT